MGKMKEIYTDLVEALAKELGREPTPEEIDEAVKQHIEEMNALIDRMEMSAKLDEMQQELEEQYLCPCAICGIA